MLMQYLLKHLGSRALSGDHRSRPFEQAAGAVHPKVAEALRVRWAKKY